MARYSTTLAGIVAAHRLRAVNRTVVQRGGEDMAKATATQTQSLQTTVSGTTYDVFILGLHSFDDTKTRYVL